MYFFDSKENVEKLRRVLKEWIGTPYAANCNVKGEGIDCGRFIGCVLSESGAIPKMSFPFCRRDLVEKANDLIKNKIKRIGDLVKDTRNGDIVLFQLTSFYHLGIFCDGNIYHVHRGSSVVGSPLGTSPWLKRQKETYRIWATQQQDK